MRQGGGPGACPSLAPTRGRIGGDQDPADSSCPRSAQGEAGSGVTTYSFSFLGLSPLSSSQPEDRASLFIMLHCLPSCGHTADAQ